MHESSKHHRRRALLVGVLIATGVIGACDTTTSPDAALDPGSSAVFGLSEAEKAAKEAEEKRREGLDRRLGEEKDRIKAARESSRELARRLRAEWKTWKKEWNQARKQAKKNGISLSVDLLRCEPQEYDAETKIIGPAGGQLKMGPHKLIIPRGALREEVVITAEAPVTDLVAVEFSPHGLEFHRSPVLELDYKHCLVPDDTQDHQVVYLDQAENVLEYLASTDDKAFDEVLARIDHFSRYALAIPD